MSGTTIVPLDGSELAEQAISIALSLDPGGDDRLVLLRVAMAAPSMRLDGLDWEEGQLAAIHEAEAYLDAARHRLARERDITLDVPYGRAAPSILEAIGRLGADRVVMATHGRTGLTHVLRGSVAEAVLAHSPVPVVMIRPQPDLPTRVSFDPARPRVLVPLDGSEFSEASLRWAVDLVRAEPPNGELVLVTVAEPPTEVERDDNGRVISYLDQQEEQRTRDARAYLENVAKQLTEQAPGVRVVVDVRIGLPERGITMAAAAHDTGLIVMSTHARTGLDRARLGSVAGRVLQTAAAPILLVRPDHVRPDQAVAVGVEAR